MTWKESKRRVKRTTRRSFHDQSQRTDARAVEDFDRAVETFPAVISRPARTRFFPEALQNGGLNSRAFASEVKSAAARKT